MQILYYILIGLASGVLGGMGMGGGTILIPFLTILLGVTQHQAQAINLISFIPMSIIALIIHKKNGLLKWRELKKLVPIACIFSALGAFIAVRASGIILRRCFGGFLIAIAIMQIIIMIIERRKNKAEQKQTGENGENHESIKIIKNI